MSQIRLVYLDTFLLTSRARPHSHTCVEVGFVHQGGLVWHSDGKTKNLAKGDLVVVPANCKHFESPLKHGKANMSFVGIRGLKGPAFRSPAFFSLSAGHPLRLVLTQLIEEARTPEPSCDKALSHWLALFVLMLERLRVSDQTKSAATPRPSGTSKGHEDLLRRAIDMIDNQFHRSDLSLAKIAHTLQVSGRTLQLIFRKRMNATPLEVITSYRMRFAQGRLQQREESTAELARACGYTSVSYFLRRFKKHHALTPKQFRERGLLPNASSGHKKTLRNEGSALPSYRTPVSQ